MRCYQVCSKKGIPVLVFDFSSIMNSHVLNKTPISFSDLQMEKEVSSATVALPPHSGLSHSMGQKLRAVGLAWTPQHRHNQRKHN